MEEEKKQEEVKQEPAGENAESNPGKKIEEEKLWAMVSYILFFIPLLKEDRSQFISFHANQGTLLFIFIVLGNIVLSLIPILGWMMMPFFNILVLVFMILGIRNVLRGNMKRLPWFGKYDIVS